MPLSDLLALAGVAQAAPAVVLVEPATLDRIQVVASRIPQAIACASAAMSVVQDGLTQAQVAADPQ